MPPYVINDEELLTITKAMSAIAHNFESIHSQSIRKNFI